MPRVLLLAATTGYQTRAFGDAAERLGVELVLATDRCDVLDDPWRDGAIPIRFHDEDASTGSILDAASRVAIAGVVAVGDRPTVIAARVCEGLGLPWHPPDAATAARNKELSRRALQSAGLPVPAFAEGPLADDPAPLAARVGYPAVLKPLALSGSRGVMRVNDDGELAGAVERLRAILAAPDVRRERDHAHERVLLEAFIPGHEFAVEGLMNAGELDVLAIFDKPDPLDGPFFEETIYLAPTSAGEATARAIGSAMAAAAAALGLRHGPVHGECRVSGEAVVVLELAARPIGGLCARALRFVPRSGAGPRHPDFVSLEELLLRHALGQPSTAFRLDDLASGVMMIPIPSRGVFRGVSGLEDASAVPGIEDIRITAKPDQLLVPLPEGASYLGFIFARGSDATAVEHALRAAHARLVFSIAAELRVLQSTHG